MTANYQVRLDEILRTKTTAELQEIREWCQLEAAAGRADSGAWMLREVAVVAELDRRDKEAAA